MQNFWQQNVIDLACNLLGCEIVYNNIRWVIIETESYGANDPASHSFRWKTKRNKSMFLPWWHIYVYLIYGMYYCLNFVSWPENIWEAVLIRSVKIVDWLDLALKNYWKLPKDIKNIWNWPWKVCKLFWITKNLDWINIDNNNVGFKLIYKKISNKKIIRSPRVGINKWKELLWNFRVKIF